MHMETATHHTLKQLHLSADNDALRTAIHSHFAMRKKCARNEHLHVVRTHTRYMHMRYLVRIVELRVHHSNVQLMCNINSQVMNVTIAVYTAEHDIKLR